MKKPNIRYAGGILGTPILVIDDERVTKEHVEELIDALLVAKRRMNDELEHKEIYDLYIDNEQYQSFVNDIEVVNKALIKAGCTHENR